MIFVRPLARRLGCVLVLAGGVGAPVASASAPSASSQTAPGAVVETPLEAPRPAPIPVPVPPPVRVTVRAGESLYDIAARLRSPVRSIINANGLAPPYSLTPGQVLIVPRPATYTVREGDTLYAVARRFLVDVHTLASLNDLTLQSRLRVGQPIVLPPDARDLGPAQIAAASSAPPNAACGQTCAAE
jgi:LysM repeat protein